MDSPMTIQEFINVAVAATGAVIGWLFKIVWEAIKELQRDVKATSIQVHEHYVRKDDFRVFEQRIETKLDRILDKLEQKEDKEAVR
jgi:hypothetical protein